MISIANTTIRSVLLAFAGSLLCVAAQASTQRPREEVDVNWATTPAPAAAPKRLDLDSLPPAPPMAPRQEKLLPRKQFMTVTPMETPDTSDRRCDPGLDALFVCSKQPSWLGQQTNKYPSRLENRETPDVKWMREQKKLLQQKE